MRTPFVPTTIDADCRPLRVGCDARKHCKYVTQVPVCSIVTQQYCVGMLSVGWNVSDWMTDALVTLCVMRSIVLKE